MGGTGVSQDVYRIKDEISVSLKIEEWSAAKQKWLPFERSDVQVEFTMLDPHLRKTFKKDKEVRREREGKGNAWNATFEASFRELLRCCLRSWRLRYLNFRFCYS